MLCKLQQRWVTFSTIKDFCLEMETSVKLNWQNGVVFIYFFFLENRFVSLALEGSKNKEKKV